MKLIPILLIVLLSASNSFAWSGPIQSLELCYPPDTEEVKVKEVAKVLEFMRKELEFIDGRFMGAHSTHQRFGGTSAKTSAVIQRLKDVELWKITVLFRDFGEQESAFTMGYDYRRELTIIVNSGRADFLLKDFVSFFPNVKLPAVGKAKEKAAGETPAVEEAPKDD